MVFMRTLGAVAALLIPALTWAQEEASAEAATDAPAVTSPWSGEFGLGYIASSGNTDTSSGTAHAKLMYTRNAWENWAEGKAFGSSEEEGTTAESYEATGRSQYNFNPGNYGYGQIEWKKNRFSAYTQQTFETVGYGHRFLNDDVFKLSLEAGAGVAQQKAVVSTEPTVTENKRGAVYTLGGDFAWQISETAAFEQVASANMTSDNTYWETITSLKVNILDSLALAVSYTIQGNTDVEGDVEKTDRYTAITLDYSF